MQDPARIRDLVRKVVYRTLGRSSESQPRRSSTSLVTEQDVKQLPFGGELRVPGGSTITPLARQVAMDQHITLIMDGEATSEALAISPTSRVSHERIESVGRHYRPPQRTTERLLNESDLKDLPFGAEIRVPPGSIVTPLARQVAMVRHITIIEEEGDASQALAIMPSSQVSEERIEAIGRHYRPPLLAPGGMLTELDIKDLPFGGEITVRSGTTITPLARQVAMDRHVTIIEGTPSQARSHPEGQTSGPVTRSDEKAIAIGADHGGVTMKAELIAYLQKQNYGVVDCGTNSTDSVDYPDYALAVAQLVANGQAWRGIIIDGAGIGSCMAANKVPGIRAAMCYDQATALNSREHNNANVLTLGAGLLGSSLTRQIVQTWLDTEFGGGRHARRVDKIMDIERRFSK